MPSSRFWRIIAIISYILSGMFVVVLAFQAFRARFSSGKHSPEAKDNPGSIVIMGVGSRFIAPTRVEWSDIEGLINHAPKLFSHMPHLLRRRQSIADHTASVAIPTLEPVVEVQPVDLSPLPPALTVAGTGATKHRLGKHVLVPLSALLLIVVIATSFLFSVRFFSSSLGQQRNALALANTTRSAQPQQLARPAFERGITYPQWYNDGYGVNDTAWQLGVATIKTQTGSQWIEIPVLFSQATSSTTSLELSSSAPTVQSFIEGIERAHSLGYKVFFVPLVQVRQSGGWSGSITFTSLTQKQTWFNNYWNTINPYVTAAASQHVEQMAIGTELQTLQQIAPLELWNQLIGHIRSVFKNTLTYDMNWSSLPLPMPSWLHNANLTFIGVSTYIPLLDKSGRVDPKDMPALWQAKIKTQLDALSVQIGKQVLITEIGYRNSADALYHTWEATSTAKADPQEQAGAYNAALTNVLQDTRIAGTFFWGWNDVGQFAINGQPATGVLLKWYTLKQA